MIKLATFDTLPVDALAAAIQALPSAASRPDAVGLDDLGATLAPSPDPRLRRLALAAVVARTGTGGIDRESTPASNRVDGLERAYARSGDNSSAVTDAAILASSSDGPFPRPLIWCQSRRKTPFLSRPRTN